MTPENYVKLINKLQEQFPNNSVAGIIAMAEHIIEEASEEDLKDLISE